MTTPKSAWLLAWEWASGWRGTTPFWVAEVSTGLLAAIITAAVTRNLGWGIAAAGLGAVLAFVGGLLGKAASIWADRRRRFRAALVWIAETPPIQPTEPLADSPPGPTQASVNMSRFKNYVDDQLVKLLEKQREVDDGVQWDDGWYDFLDTAERTADGIRRFDQALGTYVGGTIDRAKGTGRKEAGADQIIDAVLETKTLYDGREREYPPF